MKPKVKPISLRPMSKEQKKWLAMTTLLVVVFIGIGWFMTVGRMIQRSFSQSRSVFSGNFQDVKETVEQNTNLNKSVAKAKEEMAQLLKTYTENLEKKRQIEEKTLSNIKEQMNQTRTP